MFCIIGGFVEAAELVCHFSRVDLSLKYVMFFVTVVPFESLSFPSSIASHFVVLTNIPKPPPI